MLDIQITHLQPIFEPKDQFKGLNVAPQIVR